MLVLSELVQYCAVLEEPLSVTGSSEKRVIAIYAEKSHSYCDEASLLRGAHFAQQLLRESVSLLSCT